MKPTDYGYGSDHKALHRGLAHHEPLYTDEFHNEDVAHEHSDVNVRGLIVFAAGLMAIGLVVHLSMWGLFEVFEGMAAKNDPVLSPHAIPAGQLPPEPRLLVNEPEVLSKHRQMEADALGKYGWVDQKAGVAQLPIDQAKKLLLERGLPVRADAPGDEWIGTRAAGPARGESSSGRAIPVTPGATGGETQQGTPPAQSAPAAAPAHKGGH